VRLFVAIFPPDEVRADLRRRLVGALRPGRGRDHAGGRDRPRPPVRLTPADRWHITLAFLGEVAEERVVEIEGALDTLPPPGKITLRLAGGGHFQQRALWAGVHGDATALCDLHDRLAEVLDLEPGPLTPHLTVAYARDNAVLHALDGYAGPAWTVDEIVLVHSRHGEGGGYDRLRSWPAQG
jgi:RNA 2',3'-cyclic 3'-phosphodiesterase